MERGKIERGLPGWWERERQRQLKRLFVFLILVLLLIVFYYRQNLQGVSVGQFPDDSADHIVFIRQARDGNTTVYSVNANGSELRRLTAPEDRSDKREPTWTADGKAVLYVTNKLEEQNWQVYYLGPHNQAEQLTYGAGNKSDPIALTGGQRFAFIAQGAIKTETLTKKDVSQELPPPTAESEGDSVAGQDLTARIQGPFESAAFQPDGTGVAGVKDVSGETEQIDLGNILLGDQAAFVVPPGGSSSVLLGTGRETSVSWAQSGNRIACAFSETQLKSDPGEKGILSGIAVWDVTNPAHLSQHPLLLAHGFTFEPRNVAWCPDGSRLAFEGWSIKSADERELRGICVISFRPDTTLQIATKAEADMVRYLVPALPGMRPEHPQWSPDGKWLLFEAARADNGHDLYVVGLDGGFPVNLTHGEGNNTQAQWSPTLPK
jgi:TolB protein